MVPRWSGLMARCPSRWSPISKGPIRMDRRLMLKASVLMAAS